MNAEEARTLADTTIKQLVAELQAGHSEQLTRFLAAMARFHRYSLCNLFLILTQRPEATNVAGFNTWKKLGRFVKKGEKGIAIVAPVVLRRHEENEVSPSAETADRSILRFRIAHVFDVAQTDGEALPSLTQLQGNPARTATAGLRRFAAQRGILVETDATLGGALGVSCKGRIGLRPDLSPAEELRTLAHELAHEMLHHNPTERPDVRTRETEADAVAFVISTSAGLDAGGAARDYIHLYHGDAELLTQSLNRILGVAGELLTAIEPSSATEDVAA